MPVDWEPKFLPNSADLEITFTDGFVEVTSDVRYQVDKDETNPVTFKDGVLSVETDNGQVWYFAGVRKFRFLTEGE